VVQTPAGTRWQRGDVVELAARPERVYLFATDGGARIR